MALVKLLVLAPLLASSAMLPGRCEAENAQGSGFGLNFTADRLAILNPLDDYDCVDGITGYFELDGHLYQIVDVGCDHRIDYVVRDDGLYLMVIPPIERRDGMRGKVQPERPWLEFDPLEDIDWDAVIFDGTSSPFDSTTTGRWIVANALEGIEEGDAFSQSLEVEAWSTSLFTADVTIATTSRLALPSFDEHGLEYQWYGTHDDARGIDCWSVRVRGDLVDVTRWLLETGIRELHCRSGIREWTCTWIMERNVVECREGDELIATIELD